ncbi:MAG TPA: PilT/PilU family type 4a pilus ATPase [Kofleriaceae bacterium]
MSAQLEQILAYLDRDGVSELVIAIGRPIAMKQKGAYVNLTARPLTPPMLASLVADTPLASALPKADGSHEPIELDVGRRKLRVRTGKRGEEIVVRVELVPGGAAPRGEAPRDSMPAITAPIALAPLKSSGPSPGPTTVPFAPGAQTGAGVSALLAAAAKPAPVAAPPAQAPTPAPTPAPASTPAKPSFASPELSLDDDIPELTLEPVKQGGKPAEITSHTIQSHTTQSAPVEATYIEVPRTGPPAPPEFAKLVAAARAAKASDLHIATGRTIVMRVGTDLVPLGDPAPLSPETADALLLPLLADDQRARMAEVGYVDLAVDAPGGGRLRTNISRHQVGLKGTFRLAMAKPATLDELGLPKDLAKVVAQHQGFVVIAGPSGHGKTTTMNSLVDLLNSTKAHHILTVEDPIEIEHPRKVAVVSQREAGRHTKSFAAALKASLREDPDVIVIGELRDRETVEIALTASETGHLVLATMSTPSAAKTLDRLIDMFPPEEHSQVRASIAGALRAIVAQRLLPAVGGGVVPAIELVTGVLALATLIRDDKLYQLPNLLQRGRAFGMIRFDESLLELVRIGKITEDTAIAVADNKKELQHQLHPQQQAAPAATALPKKGALGSLFGGDKK